MRTIRALVGTMVLVLAVTYVMLLGAGRERMATAPTSEGRQGVEVIVPPGYQVELVVRGLSFPTQVTFDEQGELYVVESGAHGEGEARVVKLAPDGSLRPVASGFTAPLSGVAIRKGRLWASQRGRITLIEPTGARRDLVTGLPSLGDHGNNLPVLGPDGWLYFGQGTATNSGVVGLDNLRWLKQHPGVHDRPATDLVLVGHNFRTADPLAPAERPGIATSGAFSPFGLPSVPGQIVRGSVKPNGVVYRIRPDGTGLEVVAWGFRNPYGLAFDRRGFLWVYNHGYDDRGSRPVGQAPDELHVLRSGQWYGFPDYSAGEPLTQPKFKPSVGPVPQALVRNPSAVPPKPWAVLPPHSAGGAFDFAPPAFGWRDEVFVPLSGPFDPQTPADRALGAKVVRIDRNGRRSDFAVNRVPGPASLNGLTGFEHPSCARFGPDGALYLTDFGVMRAGPKGMELVPQTGALWRISRRGARPALAPAGAPAPGASSGRAFGPLGPVGTFALGALFGGLVGAAVHATLRRRKA
jgi:glucose/arabinose dehydrogenase